MIQHIHLFDLKVDLKVMQRSHYHMCTLKELLVAVIIPAVHTVIVCACMT